MRTPSRQETWTVTDLESALAALETANALSDWPVTSDHGPHATTFARRAAQKAYDQHSGIAIHTARNMLQHWGMKCRPMWLAEQLEQFLNDAAEEYQAGQVREWVNRPEAIRYRERLAEERAAQEARTDRAAKVKELA